MAAGWSKKMSVHLLMAFILISCVVAEVRRELTTRSWNAIGFGEGVPRSTQEENVIVGVVDSGIWPESPSFSDVGLGPPPQKWKGVCQSGLSNKFKCNNKIIGARYYVPDPIIFPLSAPEEESPRDYAGHGTHVAATVAGVPVHNVSIHGIGLGTARGAIPKARIAVYKTCWESNGGACFLLDDAINDAIRDGVDLLSISIGKYVVFPYFDDGAAIAAFNAMRNGVLVAFSGGNSGPKPFSIDNVAPWSLTVGNSFTGPELATFVKLGNGKEIKGQLLEQTSHGALLPLVPVWEVSTKKDDPKLAGMCKADLLDANLTKGKIVLCRTIGQMDFSSSNAAGFIFDSRHLYDKFKTSYRHDDLKVPVVAVTSEDFAYLLSYYNQTTSARNGTASASIMKTTEVDNKSLPFTARSSSRGPNVIDPTIMKPDICAPGVNIIAAVNGGPGFDSYTGTSMATPHASGIAGYVKAFHPDWSPSAIKSALITTASPMVNDKNNNEYELGYGAGNLNPLATVDPGLVYDISINDYLKYVCKWADGNAEYVLNITDDPNFKCPAIEQNWSLNLPTFAVPVKPNATFTRIFQRRVTNVGSAVSNYKAVVNAPKGIEIQIQPSVLSFAQLNQTLNFTVTVSGQLVTQTSYVLSGSFAWTDGRRNVRSPVIVYPEFDQIKVYDKLMNDTRTQSHDGGSHLTML